MSDATKNGTPAPEAAPPAQQAAKPADAAAAATKAKKKKDKMPLAKIRLLAKQCMTDKDMPQTTRLAYRLTFWLTGRCEELFRATVVQQKNLSQLVSVLQAQQAAITEITARLDAVAPKPEAAPAEVAAEPATAPVGEPKMRVVKPEALGVTLESSATRDGAKS